MNNEQTLLKKFLLEYSRIGSRLFRCNTGRGYTGNQCVPVKKPITVTLQPGDMIIRKYRPFHTGWPKGTADLIGWTNIQIKPDMVGRQVSVFTAIEVKTPNVKATKEQAAFVRTVNEAGGIATIARKFKDVLDATTKFTNWGHDDEARH